MNIPVTGSVLPSGKFKADSDVIFSNAFHQHIGKRVTFTPVRITRKRSYLQNNYYHGIVLALVLETFRGFGYDEITAEDCHEMMKLRFLQQEIVDKHGEIRGTYTKSTAKLTTVEFLVYIADIQKYFAEEFNVVIPDPIREMIKEKK